MADNNTDIFQIIDNYAKIAHIQSFPIIKSKLDFSPIITIAIPTYKRPDLLKEAINSAINQINYSNYEIIVVDNNPERDCETEKLLKTYSSNHLSYYKNEQNIGMVGNWNRCIELARGKYITILHDDDWLDINYLEEATKRISGEKALIFKVKYHDERIMGKKRKKYIKKILKLCLHKITPKSHNISLFDFFIGHMAAGTLGILYKKNILLELGGFNEMNYPGQDYILNINYKIFAGCTFFKKEIANYRIAANESLKIAMKFPELMNNVRSDMAKLINYPTWFLKFLQSSLYIINKKSINQFWNLVNHNNNFSQSLKISDKLIQFYLQIRNYILYL